MHNHDLQRFAQDWTCRRIRNQFAECLVTDPKALFAIAESAPPAPSSPAAIRPPVEPAALLICKPLLANRHLRALWHQRWAHVPTLKVNPDRFRTLIARKPAIGIAALLPQRELRAPPKHATGCWLALRHVRQAGNLGTLMRSLDALCNRYNSHNEAGCTAGLICIGNTLDPWEPNVLRASMGSALRLPIVRTTHQRLAAWAAAHPHWAIVGADGDTSHKTLCQHQWQQPTIVCLGHERHGLSHEDRALCHHFLRIPQTGGADSLNVAMAGTVLCYEAARSHMIRHSIEIFI